jgi:CHASE3 domain sensor protein
MPRRLVLMLGVVIVLLLGMLGAALHRWQRVEADLARMTRQLQQAARSQQQLQMQLQRTQRLLRRQMARLRELEEQAGENRHQPQTREAEP